MNTNTRKIESSECDRIEDISNCFLGLLDLLIIRLKLMEMEFTKNYFMDLNEFFEIEELLDTVEIMKAKHEAKFLKLNGGKLC